MYNLDGCNFTETTIQATTIVYFFTHYILLPFYITVGLLLDILLIIALIRQTKLKVTYGYQLQLACSRAVHCAGFGLYMAGGYWWGGLGGSTADWYVRNYWLMVFTMKILLIVFNTAYLLSLFISVAITCDRVYALANPFGYKTMNHRRCQSVVAAVLIAIAVAMNVDKYFAFSITGVDRNGTIFYQSQLNPDYVSTAWGRASESVRVYVRGTCLISLMILNISMSVLHRRRIKRIESMTKSNEERVQARRETNKDLTILAACQSALSYVDHVVNMFGQLLRQVSPYWIKCSSVVSGEVNSTVMLAGIAEFVLFVVVNRRLRMSIPGYKWLEASCKRGSGSGNNRVGITTTHS